MVSLDKGGRMKKVLCGTFFLIFLISLNLSTGWAQQAIGPRMVIEKPLFDAQRVTEGEIITHSFTVLNKGDQPLEIKRVQPGWGCAVAHFDRLIPPGEEGKITLRIKTKGYQGNLLKRAKVYTNEPSGRFQVVSIKAFVKVPIYLSVRHVYLRGPVDRKLTKTVGIKAGMDKALTLEESQFSLSEKVTYRIEELEPGKNFRIHFTSIPGNVGTYRGVLKLKTNYSEKPEVIIWITVQFRKPSQS